VQKTYIRVKGHSHIHEVRRGEAKRGEAMPCGGRECKRVQESGNWEGGNWSKLIGSTARKCLKCLTIQFLHSADLSKISQYCTVPYVINTIYDVV